MGVGVGGQSWGWGWISAWVRVGVRVGARTIEPQRAQLGAVTQRGGGGNVAELSAVREVERLQVRQTHAELRDAPD